MRAVSPQAAPQPAKADPEIVKRFRVFALFYALRAVFGFVQKGQGENPDGLLGGTF
jgi:hypothetical protein